MHRLGQATMLSVLYCSPISGSEDSVLRQREGATLFFHTIHIPTGDYEENLMKMMLRDSVAFISENGQRHPPRA